MKAHFEHAVSSVVTIWCMKNPSHILFAFDNPVGLKSSVVMQSTQKCTAFHSRMCNMKYHNLKQHQNFQSVPCEKFIHLQQYRRLLFSIMLCSVQNGWDGMSVSSGVAGSERFKNVCFRCI
jgi:hypothetical protein